MTRFGAGRPPTISIPVTLRVGDTEQTIATLQTPQGASPPTHAEIGATLRSVAGLFENHQEGVQIPLIVTYLDRP